MPCCPVRLYMWNCFMFWFYDKLYNADHDDDSQGFLMRACTHKRTFGFRFPVVKEGRGLERGLKFFSLKMEHSGVFSLQNVCNSSIQTGKLNKFAWSSSHPGALIHFLVSPAHHTDYLFPWAPDGKRAISDLDLDLDSAGVHVHTLDHPLMPFLIVYWLVVWRSGYRVGFDQRS